MKKFLSLRGFALAGIAITLAACGGIPKPEDARTAPVGGQYVVTHYHGNLPGVKDSKPADWSMVQYRQLQKLWGDCAEDLGPQFDGTGVKSVAKEAVLYALGDGIGSALGSLAFPGAKPIQYALYGAGSGGGNGSSYGLDRHDMAIKYAMGYCMSLQVYFAQNRDGALDGIGIIPNIDAVEANPVQLPTGPDANSINKPADGRRPLLPPPPG